MLIRMFKDDEEFETVYNLPTSNQFALKQFDFLTITDETKKCIVMFNFNTPEMSKWFDNKTKHEHKIANSFVLGTDESADYNIIIDIVKSKYRLTDVKSLGFVNILDAYRNIGIMKNKFNTMFTSFHDKHRIGGILNISVGMSNDYDFVSSITSNKLTLKVLKERLAKWITETRKMHNFINANYKKILEFDDFVQLLRNDFNISITNVFHKSYFQQFRSFVSNMDIDRFSEMFDNCEIDRYSQIWKDLDNLGVYGPTYNFKGIRIQPVIGNINIIFLGTTIKISSVRQMEFKIILTALDMLNQLGTLENQIERTKLINA